MAGNAHRSRPEDRLGAGSWGWAVPWGGAHPQTQQDSEGPRGRAAAFQLLSLATGVTPLPSPTKGTELGANERPRGREAVPGFAENSDQEQDRCKTSGGGFRNGRCWGLFLPPALASEPDGSSPQHLRQTPVRAQTLRMGGPGTQTSTSAPGKSDVRPGLKPAALQPRLRIQRNIQTQLYTLTGQQARVDSGQ